VQGKDGDSEMKAIHAEMEAIHAALGKRMGEDDVPYSKYYENIGTFSTSRTAFGNINFGDVGNPVREPDDAAKDADKDAAIEVLPSPAAWFHCLCMTAPALDRARVPCPAAEGGGGEEDGGRNAGAARPTD